MDKDRVIQFFLVVIMALSGWTLKTVTDIKVVSETNKIRITGNELRIIYFDNELKELKTLHYEKMN